MFLSCVDKAAVFKVFSFVLKFVGAEIYPAICCSCIALDTLFGELVMANDFFTLLLSDRGLWILFF